jgi:DNA-directed RNA polymerase specialized sigma24 family protein
MTTAHEAKRGATVTDQRERMDVEEQLEVLARRVAEGDGSAVEDLALTLRQFIQPYVLKALRGLKSQSDDADDLTQDVWFECYRVAGQYDPSRGRAAAYFGRVAFQAAHYKSRAIRMRQRLVLTDPTEPAGALEQESVGAPPAEDPEAMIMVREAVDRILRLMQDHLDPELVGAIAAGDFRQQKKTGALSAERAHAIQLARRRARRLLRSSYPDLPPHLLG